MDRPRRSRAETGAATEGRDTGADALPHGEDEFVGELVRRLELLEREIDELASSLERGAEEGSVWELRQEGRRMRRILARQRAGAGWPKRRAEILAAWLAYRTAFEKLAALCKRQHAARPGQRDRGPKW